MFRGLPPALALLFLPFAALAEEGFVQALLDGEPVCLIAAVQGASVTSLGELEEAPGELGSRDWWVTNLDGTAGQNRSGAPVMAECGCIEQPVVSLAPQLTIEGSAAASNLQLRLPSKLERLANDSAAYVKATGAELAQRELGGAPVRLTHVVRTDLEGDGVDEVLLAGSWNPLVAEADPAAGYYSFLLLRRLVGGVVVTSEVEAWWEPHPSQDPTDVPFGPAYIEPVALFDIDGDGTVELVTAVWGLEYVAYTLYRLQEDGFRQVAECGCGC